MKLRQSMAGLHTWGGLLPSWLLYVIIFAGTVACFDKELSRWMRPALHQGSASTLSADDVRGWLQRNVSEELHAFWMHGPTAREPYWRLGWEVDGTETFHNVAFDPRSTQPEPMTETVGGDFFFKLHYNLHAGNIGMYIVGLAGMFMLVALVSGVIIHRRIFKDFFTLRPKANGQRAWLDAHNLFGVVGFPFHLVLAYTGVAIFVASYMPAAAQVSYAGNVMQYFGEVMGSYHRDELHQPAASPASLDTLIAESRREWGGAAVGWVSVHHPDDASAVVDIRRLDESRIGSPQDTLTYDAATGELLNRQDASTGYRAYVWLAGLHMAQFGGTLVRLLYLLMGLCGCAMLIGGLQVWLAKREARGDASLAWVRALNAAVFAGLPLASLALLWGNRLIPSTLAERAVAEGWVFVGAWLLVALWAVLRRQHSRRLLRDQLVLGAVLALGLPVINGLTGDGHLAASLARADWALASVDLFLIAAGLICAFYAWRFSAAPDRAETRGPVDRVQEA
ncbi:PepSY-associated TM helix domain-containing protein [Stutzerimonas azotifigens]|uniref:PepSY domain-containing protein n=1 Tax=Stutzerimonas azotifigens TaxID=291995 RepID=A0ABR5YWG1_9GAMM|nr:PepSY-associated TM helix domain-containing protein [Stutzerimonas azotifigens]MBA1272246.1 PepSY domain-containing protein [Stutzerimonas azotifigens]